MPKKPLALIIIATLVLLGAIATIQLQTSDTIAARGGVPPTLTPRPGATVTPTPNSNTPVVEQYARGVPAIQPRTTAVDPKTPAFTAADVISYVKRYHMRDQASFDPAMPTEKIEFLTTREVNQQLNVRVSLPDDRLVCLVKLHGTFVHQNPLGGKPISSTNAYQVFDAHTGNLVSNIILPR